MAQILVLDDNADIVSLLRMVLEQRGYQVMTGRNGREGVTLLGQTPYKPDVIICNFLMPLMDGMTFLDTVRQEEDWASIPVVMLTALSSQDYRDAAFEHGATAFLSKPFRLEDLNATLRSLGISPTIN
ncbi:MAG: response regulator [Chloroflexi bacterium]|nr:response regulator [Chloroflexota bacterium]